MKGSEGPGNLPFNLIENALKNIRIGDSRKALAFKKVGGDLMPLRINLKMQSISGGRALAAGRGFLDR